MPILRIVLGVFALFWLPTFMVGQVSSNVSGGCAPLTGVQFFNDYVGAININWDFDDGASASISEPSHNFTGVGVYNVVFTATVNGVAINDVLVIEVFGNPSPSFDILSPTGGCVGMEVDFNDTSTGSGGSTIVDWEWAFGDGGVSNNSDDAPTYQYNLPGIFDVSLIVTDSNGCDSVVTITDIITVSNTPTMQVFTNPFPPTSCTPPLDVTFNNNSSSNSPLGGGLDYSWDFDNGQTSTLEDPGTITFTDPDVYNVTMSATDNLGCTGYWNINVSLVQALANFEIFGAENDTICADAYFNPLSPNNPQIFNYGDGSPLDDSLHHHYDAEGWYDVTFTVGTPGCSHDTTISVFVEYPTATVTTSPTYSCSIPFTVDFEAESDYNVVEWNWFFEYGNTATGPNVTNEFMYTDTSTYGIDGLNYVLGTLGIVTVNGCVGSLTVAEDTLHLPNALFYPQLTEGCAPLEVIFSDSSTSSVTDPLVTWEWHLGDGTIVTNTDDEDVEYTYDDAGDFDSFLIVTNANGCVDTSWVHTIHVGNAPNPLFELIPSQGCPGEEIQVIDLSNPSDSIDTWNYSGDNGMLHTCQDSANPTIAFESQAGQFEVIMTAGYNGCYAQSTQLFELLGPVGRMKYGCNCDTPLDYDFEAEISGSDYWMWDFGDGEMLENNTDLFVSHSYEESGDYWAVLTTFNESTGCDPFTDSLLIHVRQIEAIIDLNTDLCWGAENDITGLNSIDVEASCNRGYIWYFGDGSPPLATEDPNAIHTWDDPGEYDLELWVQDINGCVDSTHLELTVHEVEAQIGSDITFGCVPLAIQFTDESISDGNIVQWDWDFGNSDESSLEDPFYTYLEAEFNNQGFPVDFSVSLIVIDQFGCTDTIEDYLIDPWMPNAIFDNITTEHICEGDDVTFSPVYAVEDENDFVWTFEGQGTSEDFEPTVNYPDPGLYEVTLTVTDELGCVGSTTQTLVDVEGYPIAGFESSSDTVATLCYPALVTFTDTSIINPFGSRTWNLGNGDPVIGSSTVGTTYDLPGQYTVDLFVTTPNGCSDATQLTINVEGPLADFELSDDLICKGESVTFTMTDTTDVWVWQWDFGDGTDSSGVGEVTHTYNFHPPGGQTQVSLVAWSADSACTAVVSALVNIEQVVADFWRNNEINAIDTVHCEGIEDFFSNQSLNGDSWAWDFGNGQQFTGENPPGITYEPGTWDITLFLANSELGCTDTLTKQMIIHPLPEISSVGGTICAGDFIELFAEGGEEYTWSPAEFLSEDDIASPIASPPVTTLYEVIGVDTNGCSNSSFAEVVVFQPPPQIIWDTTIVIGEVVFLDGWVGEGYDYLWEPDMWLSCDTCAAGFFTPLEDTDYTLTVSDTLGCFSIVSFYGFDVLPVSSVDVPDAFTPNGDGVNDIIYVDGWGIKNLLEFKIYNRWGELVFETSDLEEGWDGYYKDELQNVETYAYVVVVETFVDAQPLTKKGYINLFR